MVPMVIPPTKTRPIELRAVVSTGLAVPWCGSTLRKTMVGPPRRRGPIIQARMRRFFTRADSPRKSDGGGLRLVAYAS